MIGMLDVDTLTPEALEPNPGFEEKKEAPRVLGPDELPPLEACVNVFDYELVAQKKLALTGKEKGQRSIFYHRTVVKQRILRKGC